MQQTQEETTKPAATTSQPSTTESTGKYIPPSMRGGAGGSSGGGINSSSSAIPPTSVNYRRPNKSQPNINDTLEFPTLDSNAAESSGNNPSDKLTNGSGNDRLVLSFLFNNVCLFNNFINSIVINY